MLDNVTYMILIKTRWDLLYIYDNTMHKLRVRLNKFQRRNWSPHYLHKQRVRHQREIFVNLAFSSCTCWTQKQISCSGGYIVTWGGKILSQEMIFFFFPAGIKLLVSLFTLELDFHLEIVVTTYVSKTFN